MPIAGTALMALVRRPPLQALVKVPSSVLEPRSRDWLPLFLQYAAAKPGGRQTGAAADELVEEADEVDADINPADADVNGEPAVAASSLAAQPATVAEAGAGNQARPGRLSNKLWRAQLREWLALLAGVRGVRGLAQAPQLRQAVAAQLLDTESEVQQAALRCLKVSLQCGRMLCGSGGASEQCAGRCS